MQRKKGNWCPSQKCPEIWQTLLPYLLTLSERSLIWKTVSLSWSTAADWLSINLVLSVLESLGLPSEVFLKRQAPYVAIRFNKVSWLWEQESSSNFFPLFSVVWFFSVAQAIQIHKTKDILIIIITISKTDLSHLLFYIIANTLHKSHVEILIIFANSWKPMNWK